MSDIVKQGDGDREEIMTREDAPANQGRACQVT